MNLKDLKVLVDVQNARKLSELLQKATDQLEQLEKTIDEISNVKLEISINKSKSYAQITAEGYCLGKSCADKSN